MKRLFIAIDISDEARRAAAAHTKRLKDDFAELRVSWVRPENLHITLKFLGDTQEETLVLLGRALEAATKDHIAFDLKLTAPAAFGRRVLTIEAADETAELLEIYREIEKACEGLGFNREKRRFHPHVTIARLRDARGGDALIEKHLASEIGPVEIRVGEITLYESQLSLGGSKYTPLARYRLTNE